MKKQKTNNEMLKAMLKELDNAHPILTALLRERITMIMDKTIQDIENNPSNWENGIIDKNFYVHLNTIVQKHIGFDEKNIHTK